MRRTYFTILILALALVVVAAFPAVANNGNARGHENPNGAVRVDDFDSRLGTITFLGNSAGFHLWFTVEAGDLLAGNPNYATGDSYHNVYKWADRLEMVNPTEWCGGAAISIPDVEPYNLGGMDGSRAAYYKIWNVTTESWVCGSDGI